MKNPSAALRVFCFALVGVALGIALSKLSGGAALTLVAILAGIIVFAVLRMRR